MRQDYTATYTCYYAAYKKKVNEDEFIRHRKEASLLQAYKIVALNQVLALGQAEGAERHQKFTAGPALVGDWAFFGFTSPIAGGRYRLEVTPTVGTMNFVQTYADYRQYLFANPFTLALRGLTLTRTGSGARDFRMTPNFLGYPTLVRGYEADNFSGADCTTTSSTTSLSSCPEWDRLLGSSIAVANAEIRVPLFGIPGYGLINFPYLPTEIAPFFDAGVAWGPVEQYTSAGYTSPVFKFARNTSERVPVFSTGVSARFNVLGYLIAEVYYAYPFQRPAKGAHFGFNISPGW